MLGGIFNDMPKGRRKNTKFAGQTGRVSRARKLAEDLAPFYRGKKILITGGTGSYGEAVTKELLRCDPAEVRIYSRGENAQVEMERDFADSRLRFYIGDVRDRERLMEAMRGVDVVFHLAALKHVPVGERHIWEFVLTNVVGTRHVIEAAKANHVQRATFISSDKAADPSNNYGYTKAIAEKMFVAANVHSPVTKFICVRSGNLTGSHGSVVPLFREQIRRRNTITVTDERMTRFLEMSRDLAKFVLQMCVAGKGGEIFIPKMAAVDIGTLAAVMIKALGNAKTKQRRIGVRPGEKFHEVLVSQDEIGRLVEFPKHFVVLPYKFLADHMPQLASYSGLNGGVFTNQIYSSETAEKLSFAALSQQLRKLGYFA
jgi:FlaA1/EpsC-like NDP-sugar epimerase